MGNGRRKRAKKERMEGQEKLTEEEVKEMKRTVGGKEKGKDLQDRCSVNLDEGGKVWGENLRRDRNEA